MAEQSKAQHERKEAGPGDEQSPEHGKHRAASSGSVNSTSVELSGGKEVVIEYVTTPPPHTADEEIREPKRKVPIVPTSENQPEPDRSSPVAFDHDKPGVESDDSSDTDAEGGSG